MVALTGLFSRERGTPSAGQKAPSGNLALPVLGGFDRMSQTRLRLALLSWSLACVLAHPAAAQIAGTPYEFSAQGGWFAPDARAHVKSSPGFGGTLGWRAQSWLVFEGQAFY